MENLIWLVIAVVMSVLGSIVLWLRNRQPRSLESGIEQFSKGLKALAPEDEPGPRQRGRHR